MTATEVLQSALESGLLDIGDEEERFAHLEGAAQDLSKVLSKEPGGVIPYTLVALDPEAPLDDPAILGLDQILAKRWKTLRGRYSDPPRQPLRAVAAAALQIAGDNNAAIMDAAWLTAASFLPHARLGRENAWLRPLVQSWGTESEKRLAARWMVEPDASATVRLEIPAPQLKTPKWSGAADANQLETDFARAAGPHNADGSETGTEPNPYYPNSQQRWVTPFAELASEGVARQINSVAASLAQHTNGIAAAVQATLTAQGQSLSAVLGELPDKVRVPAGLALRSGLLWWRETLYSPALRLGYREIDLATAVVAMAADVHEAAAGPAPASVAYLLREAVRQVAQGAGESDATRLGDWLTRVAESDHRDTLAAMMDSGGDLPAGRTSLYSLMCVVSRGQTSTALDLQRLLGVSAESTISAEELAVWLFRGMQAEAALPSAGSRRRRR